MKWFHNEHMAVIWAIVVELVVHGIMAFGAFLLGGFLGEIVLTSIIGPIGTSVGAWFLAVFVFGAAFQAFVLGEYMKEHVVAFERTGKGDGSYLAGWKRLRWIVGGIEIASLAFRCFDAFAQGHLAQAIIIGVFGALALWYAYEQAKVIHASVNRPVAYDVYQTRQQITRDLVKDALHYSGEMTSEEKARFLGGDTSSIDDARERKYSERRQVIDEQERKQADEYARQQIEEQEYQESSSFLDKLLSPFGGAQTNNEQANRLSERNGRHS